MASTDVREGCRDNFYTSPLQHMEYPAGLGMETTKLSSRRTNIAKSVLNRLDDLCPSVQKPNLTSRLREWWTLDFKAFQAEIKKAFKAGIPLKQRNEWETFLREEGEKLRRLTGKLGKPSGNSTASSMNSSTSHRPKSLCSNPRSRGNIE